MTAAINPRVLHRIFIKIHLSIKNGHWVLLLLLSLEKASLFRDRANFITRGRNSFQCLNSFRVFHTIFINHGQESLMNSMDTLNGHCLHHWKFYVFQTPMSCSHLHADSPLQSTCTHMRSNSISMQSRNADARFLC